MSIVGGSAMFGPDRENELKQLFFSHARCAYLIEVEANDPVNRRSKPFEPTDFHGDRRFVLI